MDLGLGITNQALDKSDNKQVQIHSCESSLEVVMINLIKSLFEVEFHEDNILKHSHYMLLTKLEGHKVISDTTTLNKPCLLLVHDLRDNRLESVCKELGNNFVGGG